MVLIAAALDVPPAVFRKVFSDVRPAPAGQTPDPAEVVRNKEVPPARSWTLRRHERPPRSVAHFDERCDRGRTTPATGYATILNGVITGLTITNPGSWVSLAAEGLARWDAESGSHGHAVSSARIFTKMER